MTYTDVFGGSTVYPSDVSYRAITLSENTTLSWPLETSSEEVVARILDVTAVTGSLELTLPVASAVSPGETLLVNNIGSESFTVHDNDGTQIVSSTPGTVWQIYLRDNSTDAGLWRTLQYGASTSSTDSSSLAGTGIVSVGSLLSQSIPVVEFSSDYTAGASDRAKFFVWEGAGGIFTLPAAGAVGNNWFVHIHNAGDGNVTLTPTNSETIDRDVSKALQPGESLTLVSSGSEYFSIGFGQSAEYAFDFTVTNIAGAGNYTLSAAELNRIAYRFTGELTAARTVIVPATVQQYWVTNATTGAFTLTIKTPAGSGLTLGQGESAIYYCDGVDVVAADSFAVTGLIPISGGGTGASTASAALINLGGTSVGTAVFTAASESAAWSAIEPGVSIDGGTF